MVCVGNLFLGLEGIPPVHSEAGDDGVCCRKQITRGTGFWDSIFQNMLATQNHMKTNVNLVKWDVIEVASVKEITYLLVSKDKALIIYFISKRLSAEVMNSSAELREQQFVFLKIKIYSDAWILRIKIKYVRDFEITTWNI